MPDIAVRFAIVLAVGLTAVTFGAINFLVLRLLWQKADRTDARVAALGKLALDNDASVDEKEQARLVLRQIGRGDLIAEKQALHLIRLMRDAS